MKPSILVGVAIGVVLVVAVVVAPQWLRSSSAKTAAEARTQAALAQRLLHRYDHQLPRIERLADPDDLEFADFEALLEQFQEDLQELNQEYSGVFRRMRERAERDGLDPQPGPEALSADVRGVERALSGYRAALQANADRLAEAAKQAQAASGTGAGVLGVPQIEGMVEYTRATNLFDEARAARREQQVLQARLLLLAAQWKAYRASQDYLAGLDVRDILGRLRDDLEEVRELESQAAERAATLAAEVAERAQMLAQIEQDLQQSRHELLALERQGFLTGDVDSFNAYRAQFLSLSERLRTLEEEELLLRLGGRRGAQFKGEKLATAKIEGGEIVIGLETLQRTLAAAQERARRLARGVESLQENIGFVEQAGREAKQGEDRYSQLQDELDAEMNEIRPQRSAEDSDSDQPEAASDTLPGRAQAAAQRESAALQAARSAVDAFDKAQRAADRWRRDAQTLQSEKDPQRQNARLNRIISDKTMQMVGDSAKAAALVLMARIYLQRIEANQSLIDDMGLFDELRPGGRPFKPALFEEQITTARDNAIDSLTKAADIYNKLVDKAPEATKWVPQASLAAVYHLLARVDVAQSEEHLLAAVRAAGEAVQQEDFPYLQEHVRFRNHLRAKAGYVEPEEEQVPAGDEAGAGGEPARP